MALPALAPIARGIASAASSGGSKIGGISGTGAVVNGLISNCPTLEDEVTVEVVGQPGTTKQQLYYLAMAAANGIVRRPGSLAGLPPTMGLLMIEYDAADHWVRCTIRYKTSTLGSIRVFGDKNFYNSMAVYRGPQCEVVGSEFDFTNAVLAGIPRSSTSANAPQLPWAGRVILTACPTTQEPQVGPITQAPAPTPTVIQTRVINSPNPKPPGDNRSRGTVVTPKESGGGSGGSGGSGHYLAEGTCCEKSLKLVPLVFAALSAPGSFNQEVFLTPTTGPTGS